MNTRLLLLSILVPTGSFAAESEPLPELADLPVAITSFGATFHDGAIYAYGGQLGKAHDYSWEEVNKPLYRLKFSSDAEWEELASDEPALGPGLWSHPSGLIRVGGMQPRNAKGEDQDLVSVPYVRRFDPETEAWTALPDLPEPRSSLDALVDGDMLYVAGGWKMGGKDQSNTWLKTVEMLDLSAEDPKWKSIPQPFLRRALAIAKVGNELFCMGGLDNGGDISLEVDILNLETEEWSKGPDLPEGPMDGFGLSAMVDQDNGKLYITGFPGKVYTYNGKDGWDEVGQFESGRMFARFVDPPNAPLVIMGGAGKDGRPLKLEYVPSQ